MAVPAKNDKISPQELMANFRSSVEDLLPILAKLGNPICNSIDELYNMLELATINDGQLKLIMTMVLNEPAK